MSVHVTEIFKELSQLSDEKLKSFLREQETLFKEIVITNYESKPEELTPRLQEVKRAFQKLSEALNSLQLSQSQAFGEDLEEEARLALKERDFEKAFQLYQSLISKKLERKEPVSIGLYIMGGTAALHAREFVSAEDFAERALLMEPQNSKVVMLKALIHYLKKEFELAKQVFEKAAELNPTSVQVQKYLKLCRENIDNAAAAAGFKSITAINRALDPDEQREYQRTAVDLNLTVNDYETLTTLIVKVVSLSASGCLIKDAQAPQIPDEFNFTLELGDNKVVHGYANKRYMKADNESLGVFFEQLDEESRDLIDRRIKSGVYG